MTVFVFFFLSSSHLRGTALIDFGRGLVYLSMIALWSHFRCRLALWHSCNYLVAFGGAFMYVCVGDCVFVSLPLLLVIVSFGVHL